MTKTGQPEGIAALIDKVMERDGFRSVYELARHSRLSIAMIYKLYGATPTQAARIRLKTLQTFAEDFELPLAAVCLAAGRTAPGRVTRRTGELVRAFDGLDHEHLAKLSALDPDAWNRMVGLISDYVDMTADQQRIAASAARSILACAER